MADRNFDEEFDYASREGHTFTLGGYTFHTIAVAPPGAYLNAGRGLVPAVKFLRRVVVPEDRAMLERVLEMPDTTAKLLENAPLLYAAAKNLLELPADAKKAERKDVTDRLADVVKVIEQTEEPIDIPVSAVQFDEVADWLFGVMLGRPTNSPSPSGNGDGRTSNGSKATSPRPAKAGRT